MSPVILPSACFSFSALTVALSGAPEDFLRVKNPRWHRENFTNNSKSPNPTTAHIKISKHFCISCCMIITKISKEHFIVHNTSLSQCRNHTHTQSPTQSMCLLPRNFGVLKERPFLQTCRLCKSPELCLSPYRSAV